MIWTRSWRGGRSGRSRSNLTLHYDRMMLMLDPTPLARGLQRKKVEVVNYPDGRFAVQFDGTTLPFRVFDKIQTVRPGAIVENKRLGAALALVKEQQAAFAPHQASPRSSAATAAEQSGGARPANEGSAAETWCRRSHPAECWNDRFHCIPLCNGERPCREVANPTARHP